MTISRLLNPKSIAVVGASPRGGRGARTLINLRETGFAGDVPEFNPLKLTAGSTDEPDQPIDAGAVQDDAEVAFSTRDLTNADANLVGDDLSAAEAQAEVAESIKALASAKNSLPIPPQLLLMRTLALGQQ